MPSESRNWKIRIQHILDAISESQDFISDMSYGQFCADAKTLKAVVANLILIGQAARYVPEEAEATHPKIPWAQMRGMRNHIVHGYDQIDLEIVWNVVQDERPSLVPILQEILQGGHVTNSNQDEQNKQ